MRSFLAILAVVALVLGAGCGDKSDGHDHDEDATPAKDGGGADTTMKDAGDAAKTADVTYTCGCGKEKVLAAASPAPS